MGENCPFCQSPSLEVSEDLYKCLYCGQYFRGKTRTPYRHKVIHSIEKMRSAGARVEATGGLSADMTTFINRVAEALAPTTGLDAEARARCLKVQEQFRRELTDVFQGKGTFKRWFTRKKTDLGLHPFNFMSILHECLEGLRSPEARALRQEYAQAIRGMRG